MPPILAAAIITSRQRLKTMTIMDLIFLASVLASFVTFAVAATFALRGSHLQSLRLLRNYAACAVLYLLVGVIVSFLKPQRVMLLGNPWCFDDWCLTVEGVTRIPKESYALYRIDVQISSRAGRSAQRAKGAWLFLVDEHGRRYLPAFLVIGESGCLFGKPTMVRIQ
jgi:hypothetical protein